MRRPPGKADPELTFGCCLFTATRNAGYGLMRKQARARPSETNLEAEQVEIGEASLQLPERQREVLALRDLEELSYDEIGKIMEVNGNTVAQLISRARINLCDEMRGTSLAAVVAPSAECERALPLIATRDDGQLEPASDDAAWLDATWPVSSLPGRRRGDAGGRRLLPCLDADSGRSVATQGDDGEGGRAGRRRLGRGDRGCSGGPHPGRVAAGCAAADLTDTGDGRSPRRRRRSQPAWRPCCSSPASPRSSRGTTRPRRPPIRPGAGPGVRAAAIGVGVPVKAGWRKQDAAGRKRTSAASGTTEAETISTPVQALPTGGGPERTGFPPRPVRRGGGRSDTAGSPDPTAGSKPKPAPATTPAPQPASTPAPEEAPAAEEASGKGPHGHEPAAKPPAYRSPYRSQNCPVTG